jgi:hypothetical protein
MASIWSSMGAVMSRQVVDAEVGDSGQVLGPLGDGSTRLASPLLVILSARHSLRGLPTITRKLSRLLRRSSGSRVNKERSRDRSTVSITS